MTKPGIDAAAVPWAVAISTRNRFEIACRLLSALAGQTHPPAEIALVDQSTSPMLDEFDRYLKKLDLPTTKVTVVSGGGGLSAGRNQAIACLSTLPVWVATPNDTSVLAPDFGARIAAAGRLHPDAACLVGDYLHGSARLRTAGRDGDLINGWRLWKAIEPACVWSLAKVRAAGGFDERIGSGSAGRAQSGEGTDLLCRMARAGSVVAVPSIQVQGVPHHHGLTDAEWIAKDYSYNVGTGLLYRRHFAVLPSVARLMWPLVKGFNGAVRGRPLEWRLGWARFKGRAVGYAFPAKCLAARAGHNPSDSWRAKTVP